MISDLRSDIFRPDTQSAVCVTQYPQIGEERRTYN